MTMFDNPFDERISSPSPLESDALAASPDAGSMDVLVTIGAPADVHFFRNTIRLLDDHGHNIHVLAGQNDGATDLLTTYGIDHETIFTAGFGGRITNQWRLYRRASEIDPDVMVGVQHVGVVQVAALVGSRSVVFTDEVTTYRDRLCYPLADQICSPEAIDTHVGDNHIKYPGYRALAYLHPDRFEPDPQPVWSIGLDPDEPIVVVEPSSSSDRQRLRATDAAVVVANPEGVHVSGEDETRTGPPESRHDILRYADLFVGETPLLASEAAILGTPAVIASGCRSCIVRELHEQYELVLPAERPIDRAVSLLESNDPERWERRRQRLLSDKIDTTTFLTTLIEDEAVGVAVFAEPELLDRRS